MDWIAAISEFFFRHAYSVVFLATIIDSTGLPFPGRLLLVAAGAYAADGTLSLPALIVLGASGAALGDHAWYLAGTFGGSRILALICRITRRRPECHERALNYYRRFGAPTIILARFSTALRIISSALAGGSGIGYPRFLVYDVTGALLWSSTWVLLGYVLGDRWPMIADHVGAAQAIAVGLVVAAVASILLFRLRSRRARSATQ